MASLPRLEPGVHVYDHWHSGPVRDFVGEWDTSKKLNSNFYVGAFCFSNPYSANMFAYLYRKYGLATARSTVASFEKTLAKSAGRKFWDMTSFNWGELFSARSIGTAVSKGVDWESVVRDVALAIGGSMFRNTMLNQGNPQINPYSAAQDEDEYVNYAIAYWQKNPGSGPAYTIQKY